MEKSIYFTIMCTGKRVGIERKLCAVKMSFKTVYFIAGKNGFKSKA